MSRRADIFTAMRASNGGTTAPGKRRRGPRQLPSGINGASGVSIGSGGAINGGTAAAGPKSKRRAGVAEAMQSGGGGVGQQLSRRVSQGAITQQQAQHTQGERALLERAYGPDWRAKVYGDRGYIGRTRQALAGGSTDPNVGALNKSLLDRRKKMLEHAAAKLKGEGHPNAGRGLGY